MCLPLIVRVRLTMESATRVRVVVTVAELAASRSDAA